MTDNFINSPMVCSGRHRFMTFNNIKKRAQVLNNSSRPPATTTSLASSQDVVAGLSFEDTGTLLHEQLRGVVQKLQQELREVGLDATCCPSSCIHAQMCIISDTNIIQLQHSLNNKYASSGMVADACKTVPPPLHWKSAT